MPIRIPRVESLRAGLTAPGDGFAIARWLEHVESDLAPEVTLADGRGIVYRVGNLRYVAGWPDAALLDRLMRTIAVEAGLAVLDMPADVRVRRAGDLTFAFNYGPEAADLSGIRADPPLIGALDCPAAEVAVWRGDQSDF